MKTVLAIASQGGHWVQLMRLKDALETSHCTYVSNAEGIDEVYGLRHYYRVRDVSRDNIHECPFLIFQAISILRKVKPDVVISTGALPGLIFLITAKLFRVDTLIWLDSIANPKKLSMSGRIASHFCHYCLTQWPDLVSKKVQYKGKVI